MLNSRGLRACLALAVAVSPARALEEPAPSSPPAVKPLLPAALREKVDRTIERGVAFLDSAQRKDGFFQGSYSGSHPMGETALAVLALCSTGRGIEHRSIRDALEAIRASWEGGGAKRGGGGRARGGTSGRPRRGGGGGKSVSTYEVALALMAVVEAYADGGSVDPESKSSVARRKLRPLPADVREWVQEMADWLDENKTRLASNSVAWRYPSGGHDHSCSQYAVLGLRAALQAGADVDRDLAADAMRHFLASQEARGEAVRRHADSDDGSGRYARRSYVTSAVDHARGWGYADDPPATPAMTAGGVSSLVICRDACRRFGVLANDLAAKSEKGILDGLAWLGKEFEEKGHPRTGNLYYLYGLERAAVLAGVRTVGGHDWYAEGATAIVGMNAPNGCIGSLVDTCFAILFLTRATDPDSPLRKRPATPSSDSLLDLAAAARLKEADFRPVFERAFESWRRGRLGVESEAGARAYGDDDMALLGPRGWRCLVEKLDADDDALRRDAFALLARLAGRTLGYHPLAPRDVRRRGIAEWLSFTQLAIEEAENEARASLEAAKPR